MSSSFHLSGGPFFGAWLPSVSSPSGVVLGFFSKGLKGEGEGRVQEFEVEYFWQQKKEWNKLFRKESKEKNRKTSFENKLFWKTYKNLGSFKLKSFSSQQGGTVVSGANCHRHQPTCIRASRVSKAPISIGLGGGFGWFFGTKKSVADDLTCTNQQKPWKMGRLLNVTWNDGMASTSALQLFNDIITIMDWHSRGKRVFFIVTVLDQIRYTKAWEFGWKRIPTLISMQSSGWHDTNQTFC